MTAVSRLETVVSDRNEPNENIKICQGTDNIRVYIKKIETIDDLISKKISENIHLVAVSLKSLNIDFNNSYYLLENLKEAGLRGLSYAAKRDDGRFKFITYALIRIRGEILDEIRRSRPLTLSKDNVRYFKKIERAKERLSQIRHSEYFSDIEISSFSGIPLKTIRKAALISPPVSFENVSDNEINTYFCSNNVEEKVENEDLAKFIERIYPSLPRPERLTLSLYYPTNKVNISKIFCGIRGKKNEKQKAWKCYDENGYMHLKHIADLLGVSIANVHDLRERGLKRVREELTKMSI